MRITSVNTGDILCLYQTGKHVKVLDVDDKHVTYLQESGERYATCDHTADAFVDCDPVHTHEFDLNSQLGKALNAAEAKAFKLLLGGNVSRGEHQEALHMLSSITAQKKEMDKRLYEEHSRRNPGPVLASAFLDQLYEMGSGSHDTFFNHRVENISQMSGTFTIDGQRFDYSSARDHLSKITVQRSQQKAGLDAKISNAESRRNAEFIPSQVIKDSPIR